MAQGSILVVDDNPELRELIMLVLEAEGYTVTGAEDGAVGLTRLRSLPHPDLVLLDLLMPVVDGREFRKAQLGDPAVASIPVVILSGDAEVGKHAAALRAADCLRKPVDLEALLGSIERHLAGREAA